MYKEGSKMGSGKPAFARLGEQQQERVQMVGGMGGWVGHG